MKLESQLREISKSVIRIVITGSLASVSVLEPLSFEEFCIGI